MAEEGLEDMRVTCKDCHVEFIFTVREQQFFLENGYKIPRIRCKGEQCPRPLPIAARLDRKRTDGVLSLQSARMPRKPAATTRRGGERCPAAHTATEKGRAREVASMTEAWVKEDGKVVEAVVGLRGAAERQTMAKAKMVA